MPPCRPSRTSVHRGASGRGWGSSQPKGIFLWALSRKIVLNSTIYINPTGVSEASRIANPVAIASCRSESLSRGSFRQGAERRSSRSSFRLLHHWQLQPKRTRHGYKSGCATGVLAGVALCPNFRQAFSGVLVFCSSLTKNLTQRLHPINSPRLHITFWVTRRAGSQ